MTGSLYIVATPIGNLEDITARALRILGSVSLVAAEDTRRAGKLLNHFNIKVRVISLHDHNEAAQIPHIREYLARGEDVAIVSDAGTPVVNDPGFEVIRELIKDEATIVPIPGPNAAITALCASGLAPAPFVFHGYARRTTSKRKKLFAEISCDVRTQIFYEAPGRLVEFLKDARATLGSRDVVVARELTKLHEEFLRGSLDEVIEVLSERERVRGEIVVLLAGALESATELTAEQIDELIVAQLQQGMGPRDIASSLAADSKLSKRDVYQRVLQLKGDFSSD